MTDRQFGVARCAPLSDFAHWDVAKTFSALDAALLVVGLDPSQFVTEALATGKHTDEPGARALPTYNEMRASYESALNEYSWEIYDEDFRLSVTGPDSWLESCEIESQRKMALTDAGSIGEVLFGDWQSWIGSPASAFERQVFRRERVHKWLLAHRVAAVYRFEQSADAADNTKTVAETNTTQPKLTAEECKEVCRRFKSRESVSSLARTFKVSRPVIDKVLRRAGLKSG